MRSVVFVLLVASTAVLGDGLGYPLVRVPKNSCDLTYGDPQVVASSSPVSIERQEDLHIDTPRGRFSLVRTWVGDRTGLGQVTPTSTGECALPLFNASVPGLLKSPYGQNFSTPVTANEMAIHSLTSAVDTRCSSVTRVLTPEGDTRFFGPVPNVSPGGGAWVQRLPEALGEPSRLRVSRDAIGTLSFDWFSEDGRRFRYQQRSSTLGDTLQYRLVEGYTSEGLLLFTVFYSYPSPVPDYVPLADGGANPYPGGLLLSSCNVTVEPHAVLFPNMQTQLNFVYARAPSLWANGEEYPSSDCLLSRVDAMSNSSTVTLVDYEYEGYFEQNAPRSSFFLKNVNFREGGSANGWRLGQPSHPRNSSLYSSFPALVWSKGALVPRASTPYPLNEQAQASSEVVAKHWTGVTATGAPWKVAAGNIDSFVSGATLQSVTMRETTLMSRWIDDDACTNCCSPKIFGRTITDGAAGSQKQVDLSYYADIQANGEVAPGWASLMSPLPHSNTQYCLQGSCASGSIVHYYGAAGTSSGGAQSLNQCGSASQPVTELAVKSRNGAFTLTPTNFNAAQASMELAATQQGAADVGGSDSLTSERYVYTYSADGLQLLSEVRRTSLLSSSDTVIRYNREPSGQLKSVIQSGFTRALGGGVTPRIMGTFYRTVRSCVGGSEPVGSNRIVEIMGPCQLNAESDTSCADSFFTPVTEYYYYGGVPPPGVTLTQTASVGHNEGRLAATITRIGGCGGSTLVSQYGSYSASGQAGVVIGPNGEITTITRAVELPTQVIQADSSIYSYEWDRGYLSRVTRPEQDSTIYCRGEPLFGQATDPVAAVGPVCNNFGVAVHQWCVNGGCQSGFITQASSNLSKRLSWIADVGPSPFKATIRQSRFEYSPGGGETTVILGPPDGATTAADCRGANCFFRKHLGFDVDGRLAAGFVGTTDPGINTRWHISSGSDSMSEVVARGEGFDFATPSLPSSLPSNCTTPGCSVFERDRLGRIVGRQSSASGMRDCIGYDAHGNVSVYSRGCQTTSCQSAPTTYQLSYGVYVGGGPACSNSEERYEYVWDDFGSVREVRYRVNGIWRMQQFGYDPGGNTNVSQNSTQESVGDSTWRGWDALGRQINTFSHSGGVFTNLTSNYWDVPMGVPAGCSFSVSNTKTRIATETAPVWNTWFSYDLMGRLTLEQRVAPGAGCSGNATANSTAYTYTPNGNLDDITYPYGRVVSYDYTPQGDPNLPTGVSMDVFTSPSASTRLQVISGVQWTPVRSLLSYVFNGYSGVSGGSGLLSYQNKVEFSYGVAGSDTVPSSCFGALSASRDGAGRIRRVRVTSLPSQAVLYERWYTWAADQIVSIDVCYQGQTGAPLNEFSAPVGVTPLGYDSEKRLSVNAVRTTGLNPNRVENGHTYEYDASGNRIKESIGTGSTFGWAGTVGWGGQLNRVAPATLMSESGSNRGYVTYAYDLDGRPTGVSGAVDSLGAANWTYGFGFPNGTSLGNGGVDSVLRTFNRDGLVYNYYYDAHNRRTRKAYPTGAVEDFFYDSSGRLISERSFTGASNSTGNTIDEYIWLGGMPVMSMRSVFDGSMNRIADWNNNLGTCPRRNEPGLCGMYQLVPDHQGKPVIVFGALGKVTGVGEYDAFGHRNRVRMNVESAHPYVNSSNVQIASGLGRSVTTGSSDQQTRFRARFSFFDVNNMYYRCGRMFCYSNDKVEIRQGGSVLATIAGVSLGRTESPFLTQQGLFDVYLVSDASFTGDGVVLSGFDYDRVSTSATPYFPPLRFSGQYFDEESDLYENWNRYYSPDLGRYLSPEPLLQRPSYVRVMAESGLSVPTYSYASSSPLRYTDPTGLYQNGNPWPETPLEAAGVASLGPVTMAAALGFAIGYGLSQLRTTTTTIDPGGVTNGGRPGGRPGMKGGRSRIPGTACAGVELDPQQMQCKQNANNVATKAIISGKSDDEANLIRALAYCECMGALDTESCSAALWPLGWNGYL